MVSILNLSLMTERFTSLRSRIGRNPPTLLWNDEVTAVEPWLSAARRDHLDGLLPQSIFLSITRSCLGPTRVVNTPLNRGGCAPNLILNPRSTVRRTHWDTFDRSFHAAKKITKGTSLLRLASGVLRTTSLVPSSGDPAGDGRSSRFKHFFILHRAFQNRYDSGPEAERETCWSSLCPEPPRVAGEMEQSPEGTEERRAPYAEVCTAFTQRGVPSDVLGR